MKKLYPSSIAPVFGNTTSAYSSSCPRFGAMSRSIEIPKFELDPLFKAIGSLTEEKIRLELSDLGPRYEVLQESSIRQQVAPLWQISGRMDFYIRDLTDKTRDCIWEVKGSFSRSKYTRIINQGIPDTSHIGQLVTYMIMADTCHGVYSFHYAHFNKAGTALEFESRNFSILIDGDNIIIDGVLWTKHTVRDYTKFYKLVIDATDGPQLPSKTINEYACKSCPFKSICLEEPQTKSDFMDSYNRIGLDEVEPMKATIQKHNTRS